MSSTPSNVSDLDASFVLIDSDSKPKQQNCLPHFHSSINPGYPPGSSTSYAHHWTSHIEPRGRYFIDEFGRVCIPRGVNLSGNCKMPISHDHDTFPHGHEEVTFVGRPFPLEDADAHFARLRRWGLTFIRFLITWEAVEHAGPGDYDLDYLDYIKRLLSYLPKYGMVAFIDAHQDVWSRYSGGSGAPAWTLETIGFDLHALEESGSAWLQGVKGGGHVEAERGVWPCGYQKLAAATLATCFWGGDTFAPQLKIKTKDGKEVPVQQFLQEAYLNMWEVVVKTLADMDCVVGFDMMNEPHRGYIDLPSLHKFDYKTDLHLSYVPSAFQSFMLASGHPTSVGYWTRSFPLPTRRTAYNVLNPMGRKAWRKDGPTDGKCVWEMHGVWGYDVLKKEGVVFRENYFAKHPMTGEKVDWYIDFYFPFVRKWAERLSRYTNGKRKLLFLEPIPNEFCPSSWTPEHQPQNMVYSPHWYDLRVLFDKAFGDVTVNVQGLSRGMLLWKAMYWGQSGARENHSLQIRNIVEAGYKSLKNERPVFLGECGVPMDMNRGAAFESDNWTCQLRMMDSMLTGLEQALIGFALWNYNPDNDDTHGDHWNGENFSWFAQRRSLPASFLNLAQTSATLDNGGRILEAVVRPFPAKIAGIPLRFEYEMNTGEFTFEWCNADPKSTSCSGGISNPPLSGMAPLLAKETEIFIPSLITNERDVVVEGLEASDSYHHDPTRQTLYIVTADCETPGKKHRVRVKVRPEVRAKFEVNNFWMDHGHRAVSVGVVILAVLIVWLFPVTIITP